jgi:hypothetical protein
MSVARTRSGNDPTTKPRSDVYTGLLLIALLAQIAGAVFLYLDWSQYPTQKPAMPTASIQAGTAAPAPAPGGPAPVPGAKGPAPAPGPGGKAPAPAPGVPAPK